MTNYRYYVSYMDADTHTIKYYFYGYLTSKEATARAEHIKKQGHLGVTICYMPAVDYRHHSNFVKDYLREDF